MYVELRYSPSPLGAVNPVGIPETPAHAAVFPSPAPSVIWLVLSYEFPVRSHTEPLHLLSNFVDELYQRSPTASAVEVEVEKNVVTFPSAVDCAVAALLSACPIPLSCLATHELPSLIYILLPSSVSNQRSPSLIPVTGAVV